MKMCNAELNMLVQFVQLMRKHDLSTRTRARLETRAFGTRKHRGDEDIADARQRQAKLQLLDNAN